MRGGSGAGGDRVTAHLVHDDTFTALTVTDTARATLNVERTDDGRLSAWIAPPGDNDGHSVAIDEADAISLAAYLAGGDADVVALLVAAQKRAATYANEVGRFVGENARLRSKLADLTPLADAADEWRRHYGNTSVAFSEACTRLAAAVDALPKAEATR